MSGESGDKARIAELERQCASLREQLAKIKTEQTSYLQNVSHQLVAPLNAIKWHIENLTAGRMSNIERAKKVLRSVFAVNHSCSFGKEFCAHVQFRRRSRADGAQRATATCLFVQTTN
jgi:signal transduction histidine kinase